jgi:hypothetical protein
MDFQKTYPCKGWRTAPESAVRTLLLLDLRRGAGDEHEHDATIDAHLIETYNEVHVTPDSIDCSCATSAVDVRFPPFLHRMRFMWQHPGQLSRIAI